MMRPPPAARIDGSTAWVVLRAARTLPSSCAFMRAQSSVSAWGRASPSNWKAGRALLTTVPTGRPKCSLARATMAATASASRTSACTASARPGAVAASSRAAASLFR